MAERVVQDLAGAKSAQVLHEMTFGFVARPIVLCETSRVAFPVAMK